ncbi:uncharacterized protein C2845_PM11G31130 [Panicum miliaceum]|uniref:Uncharacterized protein n=1 Tax=Panicum miliaceum TaxID=4540 RepID=A0A3L6RT83_PANMI|nr:uncharacterized protein C2845_PM11G31130 [Panicum miliaceum]
MKDDSAAVGGGVAGNKAATGRGMVKAGVTNPAGNKAASASSIEPAAGVEEVKPKTAAGGSIGSAARVEGKPKTQPKPAVEGTKPKPSVVAVRTEMVPDDYIQMLLKRPPRKLTPLPERFYKNFPKLREADLVNYCEFNMLVDVQVDILRQYHKKGYALVGVEVISNGLKKLFCLPEEATA